jgi:hypothetical protein
MTKIKVKVAGVKPVESNGIKNKKPVGLFDMSQRRVDEKPNMNHVVQKRNKGIFGKMTDIVLEDIKSIFGKDKETLEKEMALKKFTEMVRK